MRFNSPLVVALFTLIVSFNVYSQTFSSNSKRVSVLELYTSEGCSSCPPADKWISTLKSDPRLWNEIIPIVFHVDYWDYIGWQDPYAQAKYSQRQRNYANQKNLDTVYTPGMLLNGNEWRSWFYFRSLSVDSSNSPGLLQIKTDKNKISANYTAKQNNEKPLVFNVALLGFDLASSVTAGENEGKILKHNFVVIGDKSINMTRFGKDYVVPKFDLPKAKIQAKKMAIAAWVSTTNDLTPIQATGGWIKN